LQNVGESARNIVTKAQTQASEILRNAQAMATKVLTNAQNTVGPTLERASTAFQQKTQQFLAANPKVQDAFSKTFNFLKRSKRDAIAAGQAPVVPGQVPFVQGQAQPAAPGMGFVQPLVQNMQQHLGNVLPQMNGIIPQQFQTSANAMREHVQSMAGNVATQVQQGMGTAQEHAGNWMQQMKQFGQSTFQQAQEQIKKIQSDITGQLQQAQQTASEMLAKAQNQQTNAVSALQQQIKMAQDLGTSAITQIEEQTTRGLQGAQKMSENVMNNQIQPQVQSILGQGQQELHKVETAAKKAIETTQAQAGGVMGTITKTVDQVKETANGVFTKAKEAMGKTFTGVQGFFQKLFSGRRRK